MAKKPLSVAADSAATQNAAKAQVVTSPVTQAITTIDRLTSDFGEVDIGALAAELTAQCQAVTRDGSLKRAEGMLIAQAHTLDALFNRLTRGALASDYLDQFEAKLRLALKAQSQCRATLEALAEIKQPRPVAFVQQANIGEHVQVNNTVPAAPARVAKTETPPNELLEAQHHERLDTGTASQGRGADPQPQAVGAIHRPAHPRGQDAVEPQR